MTAPVFLLAPGRSFTSVVGAMLGQHPELFGLAETNLTLADTLGEWLQRTAPRPSRIFRDGMLRNLAHFLSGNQSPAAVINAEQWMHRNASMSTDRLFAMFAEAAAPRGLVEKSPMTAFADEYLIRLARFAPEARYLHITRHPFTYAQSVMRSDLFRIPLEFTFTSHDFRVSPPVLDPQVQWLETQERLIAFLDTVPEARRLRVRGEDILADPEAELPKLCRWLGIDDGAEAVAAMMHPEASPFACPGPYNAPTGNDPGFIESPELRAYTAKPAPLSGPLPWRPDQLGFVDEVVAIARSYGYEDGAGA